MMTWIKLNGNTIKITQGRCNNSWRCHKLSVHKSVAQVAHARHEVVTVECRDVSRREIKDLALFNALPLQNDFITVLSQIKLQVFYWAATALNTYLRLEPFVSGNTFGSSDGKFAPDPKVLVFCSLLNTCNLQKCGFHMVQQYELRSSDVIICLHDFNNLLFMKICGIRYAF